jgi:hypothetical protein
VSQGRAARGNSNGKWRTVYANVSNNRGGSNGDARNHNRRPRELGEIDVHLQRCSTDECKRNRVLCRIAGFQMRTCVVRGAGRLVMLMGCQPVMVLRMIVIVVNVGVQQGDRPRRGDQRRNEQQCQGAVHNLSL